MLARGKKVDLERMGSGVGMDGKWDGKWWDGVWKLGCWEVWLIILINQQRDEILNSCIELMIYHLSGLTPYGTTAAAEISSCREFYFVFGRGR